MPDRDQSQSTNAGFDTPDLPTNLLISCLRSHLNDGYFAEVKRLVSLMDDLAWERFAIVTAEARLESLVFYVLRDQDILPPELEDKLYRRYMYNATRDMTLFLVVSNLQKKLAKIGVRIILLKGIALSATQFQDTPIRPMRDIDFLVKPEDLEILLKELDSQGIEPYLQFPPHELPKIIKYTNEIMLVEKIPIEVPLEAHWHLFWFIYYRNKVSMDWFWETAVQVESKSIGVEILGPEASLLHLCTHYYQHENTEGLLELGWLNDIAVFISQNLDLIDWDLLFQKAIEFNLTMPLRDTILKVIKMWGIVIPSSIQHDLSALQPSKDEKKAVEMLRRINSSDKEDYAWPSLLSLPSWRERFRFLLIQILFPPGSYIRHRYGIARLLQPFYSIYRLVHGAWVTITRRKIS